MLIPIFVGLALSFVIEQLYDPRPLPVFRRRPCSVLIHSGIWIILFLIEFIQFYRPWLAMVLASVIFYVFVLINHAKFKSLKEPFIYQDFDYFIDAVKHPRLYLPFFGVQKIFLCLMVVALALWVGVTIESPAKIITSTQGLLIALLFILVLAIVLILTGAGGQTQLRFEPTKDYEQNGLIALLWQYWRAQWSSLSPEHLLSSLKNFQLTSYKNQAPHIIVVQSESFFDPRRTYPFIKTEVLKNFDQACSESILHGTLNVPAWGANTVRTEFEFLTGIDTKSLKIDRFSPYRRLASTSLPSIARIFKSHGYRTVCIHPYPASFYHRDKVFPMLGFDEFIDIRSFDQIKQNKEFPYVSDQEVTDKVIGILKNSETTIDNQPLFIFVITMENHGPLHLESIEQAEINKWLNQPSQEGTEELAIYLRHLCNADSMIGRLKDALKTSNRPGQLLWYGDHVPVMSKTYKKFGMPDGTSSYFLWRSDHLLNAEKNNYSYPMTAYQLAFELTN